MLPITASVFFGAWLLEMSASEKTAMLNAYINGGFNAEEAQAKRNSLLPMLYKQDGTPVAASYEDVSSIYSVKKLYKQGDELVMVIPIRGVLTKEDQASGAYGMDTMANWLNVAYDNESISAIVFDVFTPGGSVAGVEVLGNAIANPSKPVVVYANDLVASAGYWIAAGADRIIGSGNNMQIGSIGAYISFLDDTEYLASNGIKIVDVYASQSSEKNADIRQYFDEGKLDKLQKRVDKYAANFISHVKASRGDRLKWKDNTEVLQGGMFFNNDALKVGLIDEVGTLDRAIEVAFKLGKKKKREKNSVMK